MRSGGFSDFCVVSLQCAFFCEVPIAPVTSILIPPQAPTGNLVSNKPHLMFELEWFRLVEFRCPQEVVQENVRVLPDGEVVTSLQKGRLIFTWGTKLQRWEHHYDVVQYLPEQTQQNPIAQSI